MKQGGLAGVGLAPPARDLAPRVCRLTRSKFSTIPTEQRKSSRIPIHLRCCCQYPKESSARRAAIALPGGSSTGARPALQPSSHSPRAVVDASAQQSPVFPRTHVSHDTWPVVTWTSKEDRAFLQGGVVARYRINEGKTARGGPRRSELWAKLGTRAGRGRPEGAGLGCTAER